MFFLSFSSNEKLSRVIYIMRILVSLSQYKQSNPVFLLKIGDDYLHKIMPFLPEKIVHKVESILF